MRKGHHQRHPAVEGFPIQHEVSHVLSLWTDPWLHGGRKHAASRHRRRMRIQDGLVVAAFQGHPNPSVQRTRGRRCAIVQKPRHRFGGVDDPGLAIVEAPFKAGSRPRAACPGAIYGECRVLGGQRGGQTVVQRRGIGHAAHHRSRHGPRRSIAPFHRDRSKIVLSHVFGRQRLHGRHPDV